MEYSSAEVPSGFRLVERKSAFVAFFIGLGCAALYVFNSNHPAAGMHPIVSMAMPRPMQAGSTRGLAEGLHASVKGPTLGGVALSSLPGPSGLRDLAIAAIKKQNGRCIVPRNTAASGFFGNKGASKAKAKAPPKKASGSSGGYRFTDVDDRPGAFPPLGYWDPLGLSTQLSVGQLAYFREAELKHGRVCMLASLGFIVQERFHPFFGGWDGPALQAVTQVEVAAFWPAVLAAITALELGPGGGRYENTDDVGFTPALKEGLTAGDIGFDPLGLKKGLEEKGEYLKAQNQELAHGRWAMIGTLGIILQELFVPDQKLYSSGAWTPAASGPLVPP